MPATRASETLKPPIPFVGRGREVAQLTQLHAERKHVLILGSAGVGKSALVVRLCQQLPLLLCPHSEHLGEICDSLEAELRLPAADGKLTKRKQRLRAALAEAGKTVVFDGLAWTTPKLSSFLESVVARVPVWLCARSEHSWDIGHFWTMLVRFERVELNPFRLGETRALVAAAVKRGMIPPETLRIVEWLQRRSAGSPLVLRELFEELATGQYDLSNPLALRRLDLDRRIHEIFPVSGEL
jgi:predicted ATPase